MAILIGKKRWTLEGCIEKFSIFATALFATPTSWTDSLGQWTTIVRKMMSLARRDSIYNERSVEDVFRQVIGEDTLMLGTSDSGFTPKVGVTTIRSSTGSEVITNYNRRSEDGEQDEVLLWTQRDNQCPDLRAWEA